MIRNDKKFSPISKKGIFLGFSEGHNSYIVMDFKDHKIHYEKDLL